MTCMQIQTNTIFKGQMSSSDICFETPSLKQSSRVKCPLPKDPERGRWECNSLQESCFEWNIFLQILFYTFLLQGGITVCNLQCNMVNLNNNHILHLYISFREAAYFGFSEKVRLLSRPDGPPRGIRTNPKSPCPRNKIFKLDPNPIITLGCQSALTPRFEFCFNCWICQSYYIEFL